MTASQQTLALFGGVAAVLVVATSVGHVLRWRLCGNGPNPAIDNLNLRIKAWWAMVALMGLAFMLGKTGVTVLFALASLAALREFITLTPTRRGDHLALAITPRSKPNELIGMISAHRQAADAPSVGYWLGTPHWGKGYATEAMQGLIDSLFSLVDIPAIETNVRVINPASRRVLEKSGFRSEGSFLRSLPARGGLFPCEQFRLDRSTWAALKSWSASGWAHAPELEPEPEPARGAPSLTMPPRRQQEQGEPCPA